MFSRLGNTIRLLRRILDVCKGRNQRWRLRYALFHIYFRLQAAIFDLSPVRTSGILRSTSVVLPDLENMGIAVGILLLTCIEAKIYVNSYRLPVNGSHLWFLPYPHTGQSSGTTEDTSVICVFTVHGRHFDFRHGFLSSVIFVIGGNSAVLKNIIPITVSLTIGLLH